MPWQLAGQAAGAQQIETVETVQRHPWGKIVDALHNTYGAAEFIYVKGVSGGGVGLVAMYNASNGLTILTATSGVVYAGSPVGVFISALDATTKYGWLQISGDAVIKKTAVKFDPAGNKSVFLSATAGRIMQTSVASRRILGARFTSLTTVTSTTSTAVVNLQRPHLQSAP